MISNLDIGCLFKKWQKDGSIVASDDKCWIWTKERNSKDYPRFAIQRKNKRYRYFVHRLSFMFFNRSIADGEIIDHLCRVPLCVNPEHLEATSQKENVRRGLRGKLKTHCKQGHLWIDENILKRKTKNKRECLICSRQRNKKQRRN